MSNNPNTTGFFLTEIDDALKPRVAKPVDVPRFIVYGAVGLASDALTVGLKAVRGAEDYVGRLSQRRLSRLEEIGGIGALMLAGGVVGGALYLRDRLSRGQSSTPAPATPEGFPVASQLAEAGINPQIVASRQLVDRDRQGLSPQFANGIGLNAVIRGVNHD